MTEIIRHGNNVKEFECGACKCAWLSDEWMWCTGEPKARICRCPECGEIAVEKEG